MKQLVQIDNLGNILRFVQTNDPNFEINNPGTWANLTNDPNLEQAMASQGLYKVIKNDQGNYVIVLKT